MVVMWLPLCIVPFSVKNLSLTFFKSQFLTLIILQLNETSALFSNIKKTEMSVMASFRNDTITVTLIHIWHLVYKREIVPSLELKINDLKEECFLFSFYQASIQM